MTNSNDNLVLHLKLDGINNPPQVNTLLGQPQFSIQSNAQIVLDKTFGSCWHFDGKKDYLEISNSDAINFGLDQDFTVETWVKVAAEQVCLQHNDNDIIEKWRGSEGYPYVIRYAHNVQKIYAARYDGSNNPLFSTKTQLKPEQFYHIAFVKKEKKLFLYLDGHEEGSADDTTQFHTQNNSPLYLAGRGGDSNYSNFFAGVIANLRIYNKALSPEEIKRDMDDELSAIASFKKTYPLDFNLYEGENKESVIFIENGTQGHELTLEISKNSEQPLILPSLSGNASASNYHFELKFRPETLSPNSLQQIALTTAEGWSMSSPVIQADDTASLYFLAKKKVLEVNNTVSLTLQNISGAAAGGARTTRVELLCPQFTYQGENVTHYYREKSLSIISHRGRKNIPLHVGFVGSNRILNDGETKNELILRIVNVLKNKSIPLIPASKGDEASKFIISFDVQDDEKKEWALLETGQVAGISVKHEAQEIINSGKQGESPEWVITFKDQIAIEPGQDIKVELLGIKSSLSSGQANLYLRYENIPGYWDGHFVIILEKAPILYRNGNVGIGEVNPSQKLHISGGNAAINNVFLGDVGWTSKWAGFSHIDAVGIYSYALVQDRSGTITLINKKSGGGHIGFRVDDTDKMVIDDKGNVGIGTTEPQVELDVKGDIRASGTFYGEGAVVRGMIMMWSGNTTDIPSGWALCDGNNGTPNLKDKFLIGAGGKYAVGSIGGEETVTLTVEQMPVHKHEIKDDGHSHVIPHRGSSSTDATDTSLPVFRKDREDTNEKTESSKTNISIESSGGGQSHNNLPPYYALCFIMKL